MRTVLIFLLAVMFFGIMSCIAEKKGVLADLVLINGRIWTVNPELPWAEAVAILGDAILKVGTTEEIAKLTGDNTRVIDLKGNFALPGFIDCHTHFLEGGFALSSVQLKDAGSKEDLLPG